NTMNMDASDTAFTMMTFINCRDIIFKNNIVNSTGANKLLEADTVKGFERDFNNYHSTHPRPFKVQGKSYLTLQDYQQNTMSDLNAHDYIPKFVSIVDLHLDKDPNLNGKGTPIAGITTDIDGDIRSITPDIGADEYDGSVTGIKETLNSVNTFNSYPNPFSDYITVSYALQEDARVQLTMYDVRGRLIHTLVNTKQSQGEHTFSVNVKAMELTDNVYFLKLETGNEVYFIKTFSVR
ncbi:MAG TPA: T9SS type A sorting domain-containing protein, partial [Bacteroidia bacterium]|nr:T9SS type A sorting domain-containing protein [Bacteroidia bacterium]